MSATALISNPRDKFRGMLVKLLRVQDSVSDAGLFFLAFARAAGGATKMISTRAQDDPWRIGVCAALHLPMSTSDSDVRRALVAFFEDRAHGGFGYEPTVQVNSGAHWFGDWNFL